MLMDDALKEFLFECQVRKYTWKTIKGYRNGLEFLINYLKQEHKLSQIEEISTRHLKAFFMNIDGCRRFKLREEKHSKYCKHGPY